LEIKEKNEQIARKNQILGNKHVTRKTHKQRDEFMKKTIATLDATLKNNASF